MRGDVELMWQAMKGSHYQRIVEQLAKSIHETRDFHKAISLALGTVINSMHAETGTLWLYDRYGTGRIYPKAVYGGADMSSISLAPGEGIAGQVVECGKSVIIEDCQNDNRWASRVDSNTGFKTRTMICVPLSWMGQTFGCIQIINQLNDLFFDEKDLRFAENLAGEIALHLYETGMLIEYIADSSVQEERKAAPELSFSDIFCHGDEREMERRLRTVREYSLLSIREQQKVLRLCRQLFACFNK